MVQKEGAFLEGMYEKVHTSRESRGKNKKGSPQSGPFGPLLFGLLGAGGYPAFGISRCIRECPLVPIEKVGEGVLGAKMVLLGPFGPF